MVSPYECDAVKSLCESDTLCVFLCFPPLEAHPLGVHPRVEQGHKSGALSLFLFSTNLFIFICKLTVFFCVNLSVVRMCKFMCVGSHMLAVTCPCVLMRWGQRLTKGVAVSHSIHVLFTQGKFSVFCFWFWFC